MRALLSTISLILVLATPAQAATMPYDQTPSVIPWDSYPLASTERGTSFRPSAMTVLGTPTIDGIYDDNIGLMTHQGRRAIKAKGFKQFRTLVQYPTSPSDDKVIAAMNEASRYRWKVLLAVRVVQPAPKTSAYTSWLKSMLKTYPRISAIEPANEPEWTKLTVNQAVKYYRATKKIAGRRDVLAGSFSDAPDAEWPFAEYAKKVDADLYAMHAYTTVWRNQLGKLKQTINRLGAKKIWITEAAAMSEYDTETFTFDQQVAQAQRIVRLSKWAIVEHLFWTGWQSCIGCQPTATEDR